MKILALRKRKTGTEISVKNNGKEHILWRAGYLKKDERDCLAWVKEVLPRKEAADKKIAAMEVAAEDETKLMKPEFVEWIKANQDIEGTLKELARIYHLTLE